jgi:hypothetical protein
LDASVDHLKASMEMSQPIPNVWLLVQIHSSRMSLAAGLYTFKYDRKFSDYKPRRSNYDDSSSRSGKAVMLVGRFTVVIFLLFSRRRRSQLKSRRLPRHPR